MPSGTYRLVLDTHVILRGLTNSKSASGILLDVCDERRVITVLSKPVIYLTLEDSRCIGVSFQVREMLHASD